MAVSFPMCQSGRYLPQTSVSPTNPHPSMSQYQNNIREKFPHIEIQIDSPSTQSLFQIKSDKSVVIHPDFLQKAAGDSKLGRQLEETIASLPMGKRMVEAAASTVRGKVEGFGILIHADGSMGAWTSISNSSIIKDQNVEWENFRKRSNRSIQVMSKDARLRESIQKRPPQTSAPSVTEFPGRNLYAEMKRPEIWKFSPEAAYLPLLSKLSGDSFFDSQV